MMDAVGPSSLPDYNGAATQKSLFHTRRREKLKFHREKLSQNKFVFYGKGLR